MAQAYPTDRKPAPWLRAVLDRDASQARFPKPVENQQPFVRIERGKAQHLGPAQRSQLVRAPAEDFNPRVDNYVPYPQYLDPDFFAPRVYPAPRTGEIQPVGPDVWKWDPTRQGFVKTINPDTPGQHPRLAPASEEGQQTYSRTPQGLDDALKSVRPASAIIRPPTIPDVFPGVSPQLLAGIFRSGLWRGLSWFPALYAVWAFYESLKANTNGFLRFGTGSDLPGEAVACGGGGVRIQNLSQSGAELCSDLGSEFVGPAEWGPDFAGIAPPPSSDFPWDFYGSYFGNYLRPTLGGSVFQRVAVYYHDPSMPPVSVARTVPMPNDETLYDRPPPGALAPDELVSAMPGLGPHIGVQPAPIPWQSLRRFNEAAQSQRSPWILRQAGYAVPGELPYFGQDARRLPWAWVIPGTSTFPENIANEWTPPQVLSSAVPIIEIAEEEKALGPIGPIPSDIPIVRVPVAAGSVLSTPATVTNINQYQPPRSREKERKLRVPHWMIMGFMLATYAGGTIRNLWRSLPKQCQSKMRKTGASGHRNVRRYDSMLTDIWNCLDRVDFGKFGVLEAEMFLKYGLEGRILKQMNRLQFTSGKYNFQGYGTGTNVFHAVGLGGLGDSPYGGLWRSAQNPFGIIDSLQSHFNREFNVTGPMSYNPAWTLRNAGYVRGSSPVQVIYARRRGPRRLR